MKQYSIAYWTKQRLQHQSQPEQLIAETVRRWQADPAAVDVAFQGTALELLNELYIEHRRRMRSVHWCLFPTPLPTAIDLATFIDCGPGDVVFDPGCGLGNLLAAATARGAQAFGCEFQHWIPPLADVLQLDIQRGDYLDGYRPGAFNKVLTNPPFGRLGESNDSTADFLNRLADQCVPGTVIGAILPVNYLDSERPKGRRAVLDRFQIGNRRRLDPGLFKPLTNIATEMVALTT